jgi:hypothetical protein
MSNEQRQKLTIFDAIILVAAAAVGIWGAAAYRSGFPLPIIARPDLPVFPLLLSVPVAAGLTWGFVAVPMRTLRERSRRVFRQPGTALCAVANAAMLGVVTRWSLRAWITPYVGGTLWVYGASVLYDWARSCGLGVVAALALLISGKRLRRQVGWIELVRLALAVYWLAVFVIFSAL